MTNITDIQKNSQKIEAPTPNPVEQEKGKVGREFYKDLDKYRHRSGCFGIVTILIVTIILLAVAWYILRRQGLL